MSLMIVQELEKSKPVILTGDLNCAHQEIDIHDPAVSNHLFEFFMLYHKFLVSHLIVSLFGCLFYATNTLIPVIE